VRRHGRSRCPRTNQPATAARTDASSGSESGVAGVAGVARVAGIGREPTTHATHVGRPPGPPPRRPRDGGWPGPSGLWHNCQPMSPAPALSAPIQIGHLSVAPPVLLAPMAAVTDLPFRTICEEMGVGLTITEFLSAQALDLGAKKTVDKLTASLEGRRFGVQIFGREDEPMARAAQMAVSIGASLVDINMGCPAKRVVAGACGSALMKEPELAARLVRVVVEAVGPSVPVTVKHRAGWDDQHQNAPEFACALVEAGAKMITVHGRTRTQGFTGHSSRAIIGRVRAAVPARVPVVGNGDVLTVDDYFAMREETGCDAVMIGRGAIGNPWLFRSIVARLGGHEDPGPPSIEERLRVIRRHLGLMREHTPPKRLVHEIRKGCAWYSKGLPGCAAFRDRTQHITDLDEIGRVAAEFFDSQREALAAQAQRRPAGPRAAA
jgi:tRNA-dihydrouridine synthase B